MEDERIYERERDSKEWLYDYPYIFHCRPCRKFIENEDKVISIAKQNEETEK